MSIHTLLNRTANKPCLDNQAHHYVLPIETIMYASLGEEQGFDRLTTIFHTTVGQPVSFILNTHTKKI